MPRLQLINCGILNPPPSGILNVKTDDKDTTNHFGIEIVEGASGTLKNASIVLEAEGTNSDKQLFGILARKGNVEFSESLNIDVYSEYTGTGNNGAVGLAVLSDVSGVTISAEKTSINVISKGIDGKAVFGLDLRGKTNLKGSEVNISLSTETDRSSTYSEATGISIIQGADLISGEGTNINIKIVSTGKTQTVASSENYKGSSPAYGMNFGGGKATLNGKVNIAVIGESGAAGYGIAVKNHFYNSTNGNVYGLASASFNGGLTSVVNTSLSSAKAIFLDVDSIPKDAESVSELVQMSVKEDLIATATSVTGSAIALDVVKGFFVAEGNTNFIASTDSLDQQARGISVGEGASATLKRGSHSVGAENNSSGGVRAVINTLGYLEIGGENLTVVANGDTDKKGKIRGFQTWGKDNASSGSAKTVVDVAGEISIAAKGTAGEVIGLVSMQDGADASFKAKKITIKAEADGGADAYAIVVQSNHENEKSSDNAAKLSLTADDIEIISTKSAIDAFSNGIVNIAGNLTISAKKAIDTRGNATININRGKTDVITKIEGDVVFETEKGSNGKLINSYVNIDLAGSESYWKGSSYTSVPNGEGTSIGTTGKTGDIAYGDVTGFNLALTDGARWDVTGSSFVNRLVSENGIISSSDKVHLTLDSYEITGQDNILDLATGSSTSGKITFKDSASLTTNLTSVYTEIGYKDTSVNSAEASLEAEGSGTIRITDTFTYTFDGLTALNNAYSGQLVVFENGKLITEVGETVVVKGSDTLVMTTDGAGADMSGATDGFKIAEGGVVHIAAGGESRIGEWSALEIGSASFTTDKASDFGQNGKLYVTEDVHQTIDKLVTQEGSYVQVGDKNYAAKLIVKDFDHKGLLFIDPVWRSSDGAFDVEASEVAVELANNKLEGQLMVGQNSKLTIGSTDSNLVDAAIEAANQTFGEQAIQSAVYINNAVTLGKKGVIATNGQWSTGQLDIERSNYEVQSTVYVAEGAALIVNATAGESSAIISGSNTNLKMESGAMLILDKATSGKTLTIVDDLNGQDIGDIDLLTTNRIVKASVAQSLTRDAATSFQVTTTTDLSEIPTMAPGTLTAVAEGATGSAADYLNELLATTSGVSNAEITDIVNRKAIFGAASGMHIASLNASGMVADTIEARASALAERGQNYKGKDLWIDINGLFSRADSFTAGSERFGYKSDLSGVTIGAEHSFGNGATGGLAVSFGKGSVRGQGLGSGAKNSVTYWGANLYGTYDAGYANLVGQAGFLWSKNKLSQAGTPVKPDAKNLTLGVRAEKAYAVAENFSITPHIGVRYNYIDADSFNAAGFAYASDKADLVQFPIGATFSGHFKAACGAEVKPVLDLSIVPAAGDKKVKQKFGLEGMAATDSFDAQMTNSALYQAKLGVQAKRGAHSLDLIYGFAGGNEGRRDQTLKARYNYSF